MVNILRFLAVAQLKKLFNATQWDSVLSITKPAIHKKHDSNTL